MREGHDRPLIVPRYRCYRGDRSIYKMCEDLITMLREDIVGKSSSEVWVDLDIGKGWSPWWDCIRTVYEEQMCRELTNSCKNKRVIFVADYFSHFFKVMSEMSRNLRSYNINKLTLGGSYQGLEGKDWFIKKMNNDSKLALHYLLSSFLYLLNKLFCWRNVVFCHIFIQH